MRWAWGWPKRPTRRPPQLHVGVETAAQLVIVGFAFAHLRDVPAGQRSAEQVVVPVEQSSIIVVGPVISQPVVIPTPDASSVVVIADPAVSVPPAAPIVILPPVEQPPVVPADVPGNLISFTLINVETGAEILTMTDGMVIDIATLGTRQFTIRANTEGLVSSVIFALDGSPLYKLGDIAPFVLSEDIDHKYQAWPYILGEHTLIGVPYTQQSGGGTPGVPLTIHFALIDSAGQ